MSENVIAAAFPWFFAGAFQVVCAAVVGWNALKSRSVEGGMGIFSLVLGAVAFVLTSIAAVVIFFGVDAVQVAYRIDDVARHTGVDADQIERHKNSGHKFDVPTGKDSFVVCTVTSGVVSCPDLDKDQAAADAG